MRLALLLCRLIVGIAFVAYGLVKILGGQFYHGDFVIDSKTTDGTWLVWCFFGYSPVYARFIGVCELVPGILVLFPRTTTLGAFALLAVSLNITVMDFCFDFPSVKYMALFLTVLCGVLVASDHRRLKLIFWDNPMPVGKEPDVGQSPAHKPRRGGVKWALLVLLGVVVALPFLNLLAVAVSSGPEEAALAYCADEGWDRSSLRVRSWRRTKGDWGINMEGSVEIENTREEKPANLRVLVQRSNGFVAWRAVRIELPRSERQ
jgi:uncharacterized membrane protein YphA (DoxX/SURF4 family)